MTDAELVAAVRARIAAAHQESTEYREHAPTYTYTDGHRRYWVERLVLEFLRDDMTLADLLASKHALVRETALLVLASLS